MCHTRHISISFPSLKSDTRNAYAFALACLQLSKDWEKERKKGKYFCRCRMFLAIVKIAGLHVSPIFSLLSSFQIPFARDICILAIVRNLVCRGLNCFLDRDTGFRHFVGISAHVEVVHIAISVVGIPIWLTFWLTEPCVSSHRNQCEKRSS